MSVVTPEDQARAYSLVLLARAYKQFDGTLAIKKLPEHIPGEYEAKIMEWLREPRKSIEELFKREWGFVMRNIVNKYPHGEYASLLPIIGSNAYVFIAMPPQVTQPINDSMPRLKPSTYINIEFIPVISKNGARKNTIYAKVLYPNYILAMQYHSKRVFTEYPKLAYVYNSSFAKYFDKFSTEGQRGAKAHAIKLALRDVLRVMIGCVWLVQMYYLVKSGVLEASRLILPYHLEKGPVSSLVDPIDCVKKPKSAPPVFDDLGYITWDWLVRLRR